MTELEEHPEYAETIKKHAAAVLDPSIEVVPHGLKPGTHSGIPPGRTLYSPYAYHVLLQQVIENFMTAEDEGYDAVVIGSYSEPFLKEARTAVNIPIVSMAESTLLTACSIATYSVLVTMSPQIAWMINQIVERHKLTKRVIAVNYLEPGMDEVGLSAAIQEPAAFIEVFTEAARRGIDRFGDVIIPAEGIMNEILFTHSVREIDGVSVMDANAVAWLQAECMVKLAKRTGLHPGRRWDYARLEDERMAQIRRQSPA
ncbi:MAG TPA: aspartate/glutamate racemase family protein [Acidimicrobiales bacterium]|jgi:Asp/Glu/hydantoin racemase